MLRNPFLSLQSEFNESYRRLIRARLDEILAEQRMAAFTAAAARWQGWMTCCRPAQAYIPGYRIVDYSLSEFWNDQLFLSNSGPHIDLMALFEAQAKIEQWARLKHSGRKRNDRLDSFRYAMHALLKEKRTKLAPHIKLVVNPLLEPDEWYLVPDEPFMHRVTPSPIAIRYEPMRWTVS